MLRRLFRRDPVSPPSLPAGERAYAIGDIHGRADLFAAVIAAIDADDAARTAAKTTVILLGDLIDRGPDSAGVIQLAREWQVRRPKPEAVRIIMGNHEEMLLDCLERPDMLRHFLRYGGLETAQSYGAMIDVTGLQEWPPEKFSHAAAVIRAKLPEADLEYIRNFEDCIVLGDYAFVHAGIRPGVALERQLVSDLRWIREPFLSYRGSHGKVIVHGHTIAPEPQLRSNRIGIDTGAYQSGVLTTLGLEGTDRWLIQTQGDKGDITRISRSIA